MRNKPLWQDRAAHTFQYISLKMNVCWCKLSCWHIQGCHGVGKKKILDFSLKFPWMPTQFPVTVTIYTVWWFVAIYSKPYGYHIIHQQILQQNDFENRSAQEKIFNTMKIVDTLYLVLNIMQNHDKTMKFEKKISCPLIFEWGIKFRVCPSSNIIHQTIKKNASIGTTDKIPRLFPGFDSKLQNSLPCNKIP